MTSPASTAATSPDAPTASAGSAATNGAAYEISVETVGSATRARTHRCNQPIAKPIATAAPRAHRKSSTTDPRATVPAAAATAERSSTRAVASLSRLALEHGEHPVRYPTRRAMAVATASVGLTMAPSATPQANEVCRVTAKNQPSSRLVTSTRVTDRPVIERSSRRKFIAGIDTADENSSGGSTPIRIQSGSMSSAGTPGR